MRLFRVIVALVLGLLWLPATLHCGLDAAGVFADVKTCCDHDAGDQTPLKTHCGSDNCGIVEGGDYQATGCLVKVPAPSLQSCEFSFLVSAPVQFPEPEVPIVENVESPAEIQRTWHIVSRAARLPGAPSLNAA